MSLTGTKVLAMTPLYQKPEVFGPVVETWKRVRGDVRWVAVNDHSPTPTQALAFEAGMTLLESRELERPGYVRTDAGHNWELKSMDRMARIRTHMLEIAVGMQKEFAAAGEYDYLLLVDSDVALAPATVEKLIEAFEHGNAPYNNDEPYGPDPLALAISPIFWTRWNATGPEWPQVWDYHPYAFEGVVGERMRQLKTPGLHKVRGLGAVTLIDMGWLQSRGVETLNYLPIESLAKAGGPGGFMRGEDRAFCIRAECAGLSMYGLATDPSLAFHVYNDADVHGIPMWLAAHEPERMQQAVEEQLAANPNILSPLEELVEKSRQYCASHPITEDERREQAREQAISFAYGNLVLDDCKVTREMIAAEYDKIHGKKEQS